MPDNLVFDAYAVFFDAALSRSFYCVSQQSDAQRVTIFVDASSHAHLCFCLPQGLAGTHATPMPVLRWQL